MSRFSERRSVLVAAVAMGMSPRLVRAATAPSEVVLGTSLPLTGVLSNNAEQFREGSRITFAAINAAGGVHGRTVRMEVLDDKFDKELVVANAKRLVDDGVFCLYGFMGTPGILAVSGVLNSLQVPLVGAVSGAPAIKDPKHRFVFVNRASFAFEATTAVTVGVTTGMKSWAVVYQNDGQGAAALEGVRTGLARHQLQATLEAPFEPSSAPDFSETLKRIRQAAPVAMVFGGSAPALAALVRQAKASETTLPVTTVLSVVSPENAIGLLGDAAIGLRFTQPVPYPFNIRNGASAEYRSLVERYSKLPPSFIGMEGFLSAKLMLQGLRLTPSLQRAALHASLESLQDYRLTDDFGVTFRPGNRTGSTFVDSLIVGRDRRLIR